MKTKKHDFIELNFEAKVDGRLFDTTKKEVAEKNNINVSGRDFEALKVCIGEGMVIKGLDIELEDKELDKAYIVKIDPKDAFGKRNPQLVRPVPLSAFKEPPAVGMFVDVNGMIAKVLSITAGRALLDLNNPLAGKVVEYDFIIEKKIDNPNEKIKILANSLALNVKDIKLEAKKAMIELKDRNKIPSKILDSFKKKVKEILDLELEF